MESFFNQLKSLKSVSMHDAERNRIRGVLAQRMAAKPAGRGFPIPMWFVIAGRRTVAGVLAIVLVMGSTGSLTYASQSSLPTQPLYPVKIATEQVVALTKTTHQARAAYEIKRVEKRFTEVAKLAQTNTEISPEETIKIVAQIEHHISRVSEETESIKEDSLNTALDTTTELATTIEAHRDALQAVIEAQPETTESIAPVLAIANEELTNTAASTVATIAQTVDASNTAADDSLKITVLARSDELSSRIQTLRDQINPAVEVPTPAVSTVPTEISETPSVIEAPAAIQGTLMKAVSETELANTTSTDSIMMLKKEASSPVAQVVPVVATPEAIPVSNPQTEFLTKLETMMADAKKAISEDRFADALAILQSIDQELTLQTKLSEVEQTINLDVPTSIIEAPAPEQKPDDSISTDSDIRSVLPADVSESIPENLEANDHSR